MAVALPEGYEIVEGGVCAAQGFRAAGVRAGIKASGNPDLALLLCDAPEPVAAGVFTTNIVRAPSVDRNRKVLHAHPHLRAIVVNAGNANAGNGKTGEEANEAFAQAAANAVGCSAAQVLTASTGVIGTAFPTEKAQKGAQLAATELGDTAEHAHNAATAIMTTDLVSKEFAVRVPIGGEMVTIGGMAKGSGMIAPNMATMLAFITTDAKIAIPGMLKLALSDAVRESFNCLTVDGDTSTNDMCVAWASGSANNKVIEKAYESESKAFIRALTYVCTELAKMVARDGEGATKLVTVRVNSAKTYEGAHKIAKTIAESPLVKTALFGNDPNWGRILAAAGRAGVAFDPNQTTADLAGVRIFENGTPTAFNSAALSAKMNAPEVEIVVNIGRGDKSATVYTCDFSYDYIKINAEYHT